MDEREAIVLLHGFGGTRRGWDRVIGHLDLERYRPVPHDLPGHGEAAALQPATAAAGVEWVLALSPARFALAGYSMGGRLALHVALADPARISRLILISATAGIEEEVERARRRQADQRLAERLEHEPFERFIDRWRAQALFLHDPPEVNEAARADQRRNSPSGLASALRGLGVGTMTPVWDRLGELEMPALVLVGGRDTRYIEIGRRLACGLPRGRLRIVPGGHTLLLENPAAVADGLTSQEDRAGRAAPGG